MTTKSYFSVGTKHGKFEITYVKQDNLHVFRSKKLKTFHLATLHFPKAKEKIKFEIERILSIIEA